MIKNNKLISLSQKKKNVLIILSNKLVLKVKIVGWEEF